MIVVIIVVGCGDVVNVTACVTKMSQHQMNACVKCAVCHSAVKAGLPS